MKVSQLMAYLSMLPLDADVVVHSDIGVVKNVGEPRMVDMVTYPKSGLFFMPSDDDEGSIKVNVVYLADGPEVTFDEYRNQFVDRIGTSFGVNDPISTK